MIRLFLLFLLILSPNCSIAAEQINISLCIQRLMGGGFSVVDNDYTKIKRHELETRTIPTIEQINTVWIDVLKDIKETEMRNKAAILLKQVVAPYSQEERETWHRQVAEADKYLADINATTPLLDTMVALRGNTKAAQVQLIKDSQLAFEQTVGTILGWQQNRIDAIKAALTLEQVEAITWE